MMTLPSTCSPLAAARPSLRRAATIAAVACCASVAASAIDETVPPPRPPLPSVTDPAAECSVNDAGSGSAAADPSAVASALADGGGGGGGDGGFESDGDGEGDGDGEESDKGKDEIDEGADEDSGEHEEEEEWYSGDEEEYKDEDGYFDSEEYYYDSQDDDDDDECTDDEEECAEWAGKGECTANSDYMLSHCQRSCFVCAPPWEDVDIGVKQETDFDEELEGEVLEVIRMARKYVRDEVIFDPKYSFNQRLLCRNQESECAMWAAMGECDVNPDYMLVNCAPVCRTCDKVGYEANCPLDPDAPDALGPGDLHAMFERITDARNAEYAKFNITVLSHPGMRMAVLVEEDEEEEEGESEIEMPWVITLDNFATHDECDRLIELGLQQGYERSADVGAPKPDGTYVDIVSDTRTSENAWCQDECYEDPAARSVMDRIEWLTGIPEVNSEHLQLLRYEKGQHYLQHHDFIEDEIDRRQGPRVLTLFLYLNDVEAGGGTNFPDLDLTVMPKKGKALLWPSVLNEDPNEKDFRTDHQALAVERGVKYGANGWLHLRDFKGPSEEGCT